MSGRQYAYRLVYEAATGIHPEGVAHHLCDNPSCVNPSHLEFISQTEHMARHEWGGDWGQARKTHCPQGHPYDSENTYRHNGQRLCRECRREGKRRRRRNADRY